MPVVKNLPQVPIILMLLIILKADDTAFKQALVQQARQWCKSQQLPPRAKLFIKALTKEFETANPYNLEYYQLSYLA